jgi:3-hydroxyacyl-CoA dehydrogenase/enoyl-CoA hydratase/3-hydroxybutyryl-CoA epimerase
MMGSKPFVELCRRLEGKHGARFKPAKLLHEMALDAETFYGRFAPGRRAAA